VDERLQAYQAYYNMGWALQQQSRFKQAAENYQKAILCCRQTDDLQPYCVDAHHNLGIVLAEQGRWQAAIYHYHRAIALEPKLVSAYGNLGIALLHHQESAAALEIYRQALAIEVDVAQRATTNRVVWSNLYYGLGQALQMEVQLEAAIAEYYRAIDLDPENANVKYSLALVLQQQGDHAQAIPLFQQALQIDPQLHPIEGDCGFSWIALGEFAAAIDCFRRAIASDTKLVEAYCRDTQALPDVAEPDDMMLAKFAFSKFLDLLRSDSPCLDVMRDQLHQSLVHWGHVLMAYGGHQLAQAAIRYQQAIQVKPESIEPYLLLASCWWQYDIPELAMRVCDQLQMQLQQLEGTDRSVVKLLEQRQQWQMAIAYCRWTLNQADRVAKENTTAATEPIARICAGLNCHPCLKRITHEFEPLELAPGISRLTFAKSSFRNLSTQGLDASQSHASQSQLSVTRIVQGRAWVASRENAWKVCNGIAIFDTDGTLIPHLSRNYPGELPGCHYPGTLTNLPMLDSLPVPKQIIGKVAVLSGLSGDVYFHWMIDILPRLEILRRNNINFEEIDWFLVNSQDKSFQRETLKAFNIPENRVLESDRYSYIAADELIIPAFSGNLGWVEDWTIFILRDLFLTSKSKQVHRNFIDLRCGVKYCYKDGHSESYTYELIDDQVDDQINGQKINVQINDQINEPIDERVNNQVKDRVNNQVKDLNVVPMFALDPIQDASKLYISRTDAHYRRLLNENAVTLFLKSLGFIVLTLDGLSVAEQADIFSRASCIVSPHGSSLTNLVFCTPRTKILEIVSPNYVRHYFWRISRQLQLDHYVVYGETLTCNALQKLMFPSALAEDIWVDIARLEQAIQFALGG
jgi:tetratricopeptide (TPR) repeat protein/capsular polysaccharide biosynthesis protein